MIAAGPASGRVAEFAGISLPIEPRKRTVFMIRAPLDNSGMPLVFDTTGMWIRPEGEGFICGISPPADRDHDATGDFDPDLDLLEDPLWPLLAHRIPALGHPPVLCPGRGARRSRALLLQAPRRATPVILV